MHPPRAQQEVLLAIAFHVCLFAGQFELPCSRLALLGSQLLPPAAFGALEGNGWCGAQERLNASTVAAWRRVFSCMLQCLQKRGRGFAVTAKYIFSTLCSGCFYLCLWLKLYTGEKQHGSKCYVKRYRKPYGLLFPWFMIRSKVGGDPLVVINFCSKTRFSRGNYVFFFQIKSWKKIIRVVIAHL